MFLLNSALSQSCEKSVFQPLKNQRVLIGKNSCDKRRLFRGGCSSVDTTQPNRFPVPVLYKHKFDPYTAAIFFNLTICIIVSIYMYIYDRRGQKNETDFQLPS